MNLDENDKIIELSITYSELRYILAVLSQGAQLGLFRGLDRKPANDLYNKLYDILEKARSTNGKN